MIEHDSNKKIEEILQNYRPIEPSSNLREHILSNIQAEPQENAVELWSWGLKAAVAAILLLAIILELGQIGLIRAFFLLTPGKGF